MPNTSHHIHRNEAGEVKPLAYIHMYPSGRRRMGDHVSNLLMGLLVIMLLAGLALITAPFLGSGGVSSPKGHRTATTTDDHESR